MINQIKAAICVLLGLLLSAGSFAQGPEIPAIKDRLIAFMDLTNSKNYTEAFGYMYPRMFEMVSNEELVEFIKTIDQNVISLAIYNPVIDSFSFPLSERNEIFVRIDYTADLKVDVVTGSMFDTPAACDAMQGQFESIYGKENVKWNKD